jgi:pyruvyltransferase
MKALASLFSSMRGGAGGDSAVVKRACLEGAAEPQATDAAPIALSYAIGVRTIGDLVSPVAVQYATGRPTVWKPHESGPHLLAVGSILHWATPESHIWGTGLDPSQPIGELDGERIWALRGKLTHDLLKPEVSGLRDVPLGDPAYLVGRCLAALVPAPSRAHRLGIVPHVTDGDHPAVSHLRGQDGVLVLDVRDPAPTFFKQLMDCQVVASSSLHKLIFAEALGIPNVWLDFGREDPERAFEHQDWFSLADKPQKAPLRIGPEAQASELVAASALHEMKIDERALRDAVPRTMLDELSLSPKKSPRLVHFLTCRRRPMPIFLTCGNLGPRLLDIAASYRRQSVASELILVDDGRGSEETQAAIRALQQEGAQVRVIDPGTRDQQSRSLQHVIGRYFKRWGEPQRYAIVSDAIDFSATSPDAFALYGELLDRFPDVDAVGPMLRIQDLPFGHPVLNAEIAAHWLRERSWCETSLGPASFVRSSLTGNFAVCRAGGRYLPPQSGLRAHHPFDARNLSWMEPAAQGERPARRLYW